MSNNPDTLTPDSAALPPRAAVPPKREPAFLERAKRILAGDIRPEDYRPVPDCVVREADEYLAELRREQGITATPEAREQMIRDRTFQYHHRYNTVLVKQTDRGVLILAVGDEQIGAVMQKFNPDYRDGFALAFAATD